MKIEAFILGMKNMVDQWEEEFFNQFGETPENFKKSYYMAPEKIKEIKLFIEAINIMKSRIEMAKKIKNGFDISDDEVRTLLEIEAGKECDELVQIATDRNIISSFKII